jgi:D-threo-aldose 1-dehydrogenase
MADLCAEWGTDLPTAALQFSLRDPDISSTIVGFTKPERLDAIDAAVDTSLGDDFWAALERLTPAPEHWLDHR